MYYKPFTINVLFTNVVIHVYYLECKIKILGASKLKWRRHATNDCFPSMHEKISALRQVNYARIYYIYSFTFTRQFK